MVEKIGIVKNPLTIIAIFASIAELSGTVVLPFVKDQNQATFIWFLMLFPIVLITLFFITLNFNHTVLYAPSDYQNERNFIEISKSAPLLRAKKLRTEYLENIQNEDGKTPECTAKSKESESKTIHTTTNTITTPIQKLTGKLTDQNFKGRYLVAEELVIAKLSKEFDIVFMRDVQLGKNGKMFDGIAVKNGTAIAVEVKYFRGIHGARRRIDDTVERLVEDLLRLPNEILNSVTLILAIATDLTGDELNCIKTHLDEAIGPMPYPIQYRLFNVESLENEFNFM